MARVSIITSVHATGAWLPEMLASIPWDMPGLEVIVTANGREDWDAVHAAATAVHSVVLRSYTLTLSDSLNVMLGGCAGEYVMRLDPDDKLPPGTLAEMLAAAEAAEQPCVVYGGYVDFGAAARVIPAGDCSIEGLRARNPGGYNVLASTALARQIGGWQEVGWEDWHYLARLVLAGAHPVKMPKPVLFHRVRTDGRWAEFYRDNDARIALVREVLA